MVAAPQNCQFFFMPEAFISTSCCLNFRLFTGARPESGLKLNHFYKKFIPESGLKL